MLKRMLIRFRVRIAQRHTSACRRDTLVELHLGSVHRQLSPFLVFSWIVLLSYFIPVDSNGHFCYPSPSDNLDNSNTKESAQKGADTELLNYRDTTLMDNVAKLFTGVVLHLTYMESGKE